MKLISIYFENDSELSEYESISKGYRNDIYIKSKENIYNVRAYTITRLQQDFDTETESEGFFLIEPNLILVKDASKEKIIQTINFLYERGYFDVIKTIDCNDLMNLVKIQ